MKRDFAAFKCAVPAVSKSHSQLIPSGSIEAESFLRVRTSHRFRASDPNICGMPTGAWLCPQKTVEPVHKQNSMSEISKKMAR